MKVIFKTVSYLLITGLLISSCKKTSELVNFTEDDEILLGEKLSQTLAESEDYKIIPENENTIPYGYVISRLNEIVSSTSISRDEEFTWSISLIDDEERKAFALPGGYIYITSGMIFFLDNEDQFSGLIAHLVAHIDQSHITRTLFLKYSVNQLKSAARSDDQELFNQILSDLDLTNSTLSTARENELQADTLAISYLSGTDQSCTAEALFFSKLLNVQPDQQSEFATFHRLESERVSNIEMAAESRGCNVDVDSESASRFRSFRNSLP